MYYNFSFFSSTWIVRFGKRDISLGILDRDMVDVGASPDCGNGITSNNYFSNKWRLIFGENRERKNEEEGKIFSHRGI